VPALPTVILTRESRDNQRLADRLRGLGAAVIDAPCIGIRLLPVSADDAAAVLLGAAALALTSRRAAEALAPAAAAVRESAVPLAAVGRSTADATRTLLGLEPRWTTDEATGEALARDLVATLPPAAEVVHARGDRTTGTLAQGLREGGLRLREWHVYAHEAVTPPALALTGPAVAVFSSPSAAEGFLRANPSPAGLVALAGGPTTAAALRRLGVSRVEVAEGPAPDQLFDGIRRILKEWNP